MTDVDNSPLGKGSDYTQPYQADVLFPLERSGHRNSLNLSSALPFHGEDLWTSYEFSWLETSGKPVNAIVCFRFQANSPNMIESKSFKLYLNGFAQKQFDHREAVLNVLLEDLLAVVGSPVSVEFVDELLPLPDKDAICIDALAISDFEYEPNSNLLRCEFEGAQQTVDNEHLYSDLLRSNCPVTGQADWASIFFRYTGKKIDRESLLRYVVSFRQHQGFHENCVEQMFVDLMEKCQCQSLSVYARYTRRGGLDINPYRASFDYPAKAAMIRTLRQ